jgi:hypothetical protein
MLAIKAYVKAIAMTPSVHASNAVRFKYFTDHGIRLAIGYGELSRFDPSKGTVDGEAVYLSGRKISEESTHQKARVSIKNTLFFVSHHQALNNEIEPLLALLDVLLAKATGRQCQVLYLKLRGLSEEAIAEAMSVSQPVVNRHSTAIGWHAIEKTIIRFSDIIKPL